MSTSFLSFSRCRASSIVLVDNNATYLSTVFLSSYKNHIFLDKLWGWEKKKTH